MTTEFKVYTHRWGQPLILCEDGPDDSPAPTEGADDDSPQFVTPDQVNDIVNRALSNREKKLAKQMKGFIDEAGFVKPNDLEAMFQKFSPGADAPTESNDVSPNGKDDNRADGTSPLQLEKLNSKINELEARAKEAEDNAAKKEEEMRIGDRNRLVESIFSTNNATDPVQARKLIQDDLVYDEDIGWGVPVKTGYGTDVAPVEDFAKTWLQDNPHFVKHGRQGAGAGGGGEAPAKGKWTPEKLQGISQEDYLKNREQIQRDLEEQAGV